ncbi:hypothetical protein [Bremerella volcania]|uniref:hypothetical protein n=1 Tax=Bremerella volcania TaxID=2527984 RepID=UPI0013FD09DB|nr:hypothetical protein [Bremerella volcania]
MPGVCGAMLIIAGNGSSSLVAQERPAHSPVMLQGDWVPDHPYDVDFDRLPRVPAQI